MDFATLVPEVLKQSVLAGVLLFILGVFWNYFKAREEKRDERDAKKDEAMLNLMTNHSAKLLEVQERSIQSSGEVATAINGLKESTDDFRETVLREFDEVKGGRKIRPLITHPSSVKAAVADSKI